MKAFTRDEVMQMQAGPKLNALIGEVFFDGMYGDFSRDIGASYEVKRKIEELELRGRFMKGIFEQKIYDLWDLVWTPPDAICRAALLATIEVQQ